MEVELWHVLNRNNFIKNVLVGFLASASLYLGAHLTFEKSVLVPHVDHVDDRAVEANRCSATIEARMTTMSVFQNGIDDLLSILESIAWFIQQASGCIVSLQGSWLPGLQCNGRGIALDDAHYRLFSEISIVTPNECTAD